MRFLPNCRCHILLIDGIKGLLRKLDALCLNYEQVDYLYALFRYRVSCKIVVRSGHLLDNVHRAFHFNQQNRSGENAQHREKEILEYKVQKTIAELLLKY